MILSARPLKVEAGGTGRTFFGCIVISKQHMREKGGNLFERGKQKRPWKEGEGKARLETIFQ